MNPNKAGADARSVGRSMLVLGLVCCAHVGIAAAQEQESDTAETNGPSPSWSCRATGVARNLPSAARESSGLARSLRRPGILWTHNDRGNDSDLFAIDEDGRLVQMVRARVPAIDWEDLEMASCEAEAGSCLFVADIGDNDADRRLVAIYRIPEPRSDTRVAEATAVLRARFPEGPRDAEALFALPTGDLFIVTKGRRSAITLYRYPAPQRPEEIVDLERVRALFPEPDDEDGRVTAATSTPDGRWIGIRTYRALYVYDANGLISGRAGDPTTIDLAPLSEGQGEGLAMADDGTVWLSSEAANRRSAASLNQLACEVPD